MPVTYVTVGRLKIKVPDAMMRSDARRMFSFTLVRWRALALAALMLIFSSLLGLVLPLAIRWLVDTVIISRDLSQLNGVTLGLLALFAVQSGLSVAYSYLIARVGERLIADMRLLIFERVQSLPLKFFAERRTGEIVSRVSSDVTVLQGALTDTPIRFLQQLVTLIGGFVLMFVISWQLTLMVFALVPPLILIGALFGRRLGRLSTEVQDRLAEATVTLEEMLSGIRIVKSFAREDFERERFSVKIENAYETAMRRDRLHAMFSPLISLLGFAALAFLLWYGGRQVVLGVLTPGELIALLFYMMMVAGPMGEFAGLYGQISEALGAGRRVFELLDAVPEPIAVPNAIQPNRFQGRVDFAGVGFSYDGVQRVLDRISLCVAPGETIAIVGPSGVGKTTLVNLIPRFYEPTDGTLAIDGRDIRDYDLRGLRQQIGIGRQDTFLCGGPIEENIRYGNMGASRDEIVAAARAANAHEFIHSFPNGYETIVGEKGIKLSVGQRQRITIARVLLKDPRILILDEATSSLDSESERMVQEALERLVHGRTTFVIAHRLSTVQRTMRIVALLDGRIAEEGKHSELIARGGLYHRLWTLQSAVTDVSAAIGGDATALLKQNLG
ncbi:MAG: ABC transporter ATP-binding protein/permease [Chloroflexi bacterium]|nr:ABC transporter ATP-binding protein/permease [Chloroflexota bacterium]